MAAKSIAGTPADIKSAFTIADLVGTETINATVTAGQIAIIFDSAVDLRSLNVETLIERLEEAFNEGVTKLL